MGTDDRSRAQPAARSRTAARMNSLSQMTPRLTRESIGSMAPTPERLVTPEQARENLELARAARGESWAGLSRMIGKNSAYLHQYVTRGTPQRLHEDHRLELARYLGIDERRLGARDPWSPKRNS